MTESVTLTGAVADGRPFHPRACKPVPQRGTPSAVPSNPNSRLGRKASPVAQGGVEMDAIYVGIDVSKDRLDVHVRPAGETFAVARDGKGLNELLERLRSIAPRLIAIEATGGYETIAAAAIAGAHPIRPKCATSRRRSASGQRQIRSMPVSSPASQRR